MTLKTINPSTGEVIQEYENTTEEEIIDKTRKAKEAFGEWKKDAHKRADYIYAFASELRKNKDNHSREQIHNCTTDWKSVCSYEKKVKENYLVDLVHQLSCSITIYRKIVLRWSLIII